MKRFLLLAGCCAPLALQAQTQFADSPLHAQFITTDIANFWRAFDTWQTGYQGNPFADLYLRVGSQGVQDFIPYRLVSADALLATVQEQAPQYRRIRAQSLLMLAKEKQCRATFYALEYWYPKATFPPVYFVVGRFNTAGMASKNGLIIGAEKIDPNEVPFLVAHEIIHFQQHIPYKYNSLLERCIKEGGADFVGELIGGTPPPRANYAYGEAHARELWTEFAARMNQDNNQDWLYGQLSGRDQRPTDLGYWIGYQITKAYFEKAADKKQAFEDILNVPDCKEFLAKSGYAEKMASATPR